MGKSRITYEPRQPTRLSTGNRVGCRRSIRGLALSSLAALVLLVMVSLSLAEGLAESQQQRVVEDITFDKNAKTVSYTVTAPAFIRVRVGAIEGPLYATIRDWQKLEGNRYVCCLCAG